MKSNLPKVIDADALNILSESNEKYNLSNCITTPHPKEAGKLLGITSDRIQEDRCKAIQKLYQKHKAVTVLKGVGSLIYNGDNIYLCPYGNPGMAVAGMGDILTGLIAGFLTQGISHIESTILGVYLHAITGDEIAKNKGEIGILPTDIVENIRLKENCTKL